MSLCGEAEQGAAAWLETLLLALMLSLALSQPAALLLKQGVAPALARKLVGRRARPARRAARPRRRRGRARELIAGHKAAAALGLPPGARASAAAATAPEAAGSVAVSALATTRRKPVSGPRARAGVARRARVAAVGADGGGDGDDAAGRYLEVACPAGPLGLVLEDDPATRAALGAAADADAADGAAPPTLGVGGPVVVELSAPTLAARARAGDVIGLDDDDWRARPIAATELARRLRAGAERKGARARVLVLWRPRAPADTLAPVMQRAADVAAAEAARARERRPGAERVGAAAGRRRRRAVGRRAATTKAALAARVGSEARRARAAARRRRARAARLEGLRRGRVLRRRGALRARRPRRPRAPRDRAAARRPRVPARDGARVARRAASASS